LGPADPTDTRETIKRKAEAYLASLYPQ
jgi:hypothetical protein